MRLGLGLNDLETAIVTSSHSGSEAHVTEVNRLLDRFHIDWRWLQCGEHAPIERSVQYAHTESKARRLQNNCSGKHTMMLATCKLNNWDLASYRELTHPLQQKIVETIADLCEVTIKEIIVGLDGCGLPTYGISVKALMSGFAKFNVNSPDTLIQQIARSMLSNSLFVSGRERLDYEITRACSGKVISKSGAGGITMLSLQEAEPVSILIKMFDTDEHIRVLVVKRILQQLGVAFESSNKLFEETILNLDGKEAAVLKLNEEALKFSL